VAKDIISHFNNFSTDPAEIERFKNSELLYYSTEDFNEKPNITKEEFKKLLIGK
jgi:hypothetical protein